MPRKVQFKTPWGCCYIDPRYVVAISGDYEWPYYGDVKHRVRDAQLIGGQTMTVLDDPNNMQMLLDAGDPE